MSIFKKIALLLLFVPLMSACEEQNFSGALVAYNHTIDKPVYKFTVNGAMGPNVDPESGGGKRSCCVSLPKKWHPGLHVKVVWVYDRLTDDSPQLPPQSADVEIPMYDHAGNIHVHFYDKDIVRIVISNCGAEHPFYPMDPQLLLPWKANRTKDEYLKFENPRGPGHAC
ncbi:DUF3304 domain-containing protein [Massilia eburnea]|uniref:DUF3304 domain-containing protein n=1 Tax=Massilia eburnea TaxID=1776165 RepID=UPI003D6C03C7